MDKRQSMANADIILLRKYMQLFCHDGDCTLLRVVTRYTRVVSYGIIILTCRFYV